MNLFRCTFRFAMLSVFLLLLLLVAPAWAHKIWLNPADHFPAPGSTVELGIGWGHKYPTERTHEKLKEGMPEKIQAVAPDGKAAELVKLAHGRYSLKVTTPGTYLVMTKGKSGFFTKTPEGRKWGNKTEIANAVQCTNYHLSGKTAIMVGNSEQGFDRVTGQDIELIPLTNPGQVKKGEIFKIKLLLDGKPVVNVPLKAAYAGFDKVDKTNKKAEKKKNDRPFPAEAITDNQGVAELRFDRPGYWLVSLSHKPPYPDLAVCDQYMYNVTFTLEVK
ncbi:MAG: DUF4198 domain-containing protein [Candidatus Electrothrix sp. AR4]|nr:DUF4198 domain-containing protein [Candidatus Electrothrix sp. AR4]